MTRFIAEISSNHNGNKERCLDMIRAAAACGCWGVKFQLFRIEHLFAPEILRHSEIHRQRRRWELPLHFLPDLASCARNEGMAFGCTPFDLEAVDILEPHLDFLKVASYELPWLDLIHKCGCTGLPLMISTGMATEDEIIRAVETARDSGTTDLTVFHCISNYPVAAAHCNLASVGRLKELFPDTNIGWSDHSVNPGVVSRAVQHWKCDAVEFHFDLEGQGEEFSAGHCWLPEQIAPLIEENFVNSDPLCDGSPTISAAESELDERQWRADPSDGLRPNLEIRNLEPWRRDPMQDAPVVVCISGGPGLGHLVRLLSVAEILRLDHGFVPVFQITETPGALKLLARNGFQHFSSRSEFLSTQPAAVIIDQKEPCQQLIKSLQNEGIPTVVIDRPDCLEADLTIIPSHYWQEKAELNNYFGGPDYQLLRGDVLQLRPAGDPMIGRRLVVSFGGEDPNLLTEKAAAALSWLNAHTPVQFIIGPDFRKHRRTWPPDILQRDNFRLIETGDPLESILPGAGLLITAMGVTIGEANLLGVPVAVLTNYRSDEKTVARLQKEEVVANLGHHADLSVEDLASKLKNIWEDFQRRKEISAQGFRKTDGLGARRVALLISELVQDAISGKDGSC